MTPHKHAALIHAWADGATIQVLGSKNRWVDIDSPFWDSGYNYRIKPDVIRYKRYLIQFLPEEPLRLTCLMEWQTEKDPTRSIYFIKWIDTEWQEVEV